MMKKAAENGGVAAVAAVAVGEGGEDSCIRRCHGLQNDTGHTEKIQTGMKIAVVRPSGSDDAHLLHHQQDRFQ